MIIQHHHADLPTPTGLMRTTVYRPEISGQFPAIIFYSENHLNPTIAIPKRCSTLYKHKIIAPAL